MPSPKGTARAVVEAVAASIEAEVPEAGQWQIEKYDAVWRNPDKGRLLSVYAPRTYKATDVPGGARWTGGYEKMVEVTVEYSEPAGEIPGQLDRDEEAELMAYDVADLLEDWATKHQILNKSDGTPLCNRFDHLGTDFVPAQNREAFSRYCRLSFAGRVEVGYA